MVNGAKSVDRLEGFISKIEDFHRLMNFLEVTVHTYIDINIKVMFHILYLFKFIFLILVVIREN